MADYTACGLRLIAPGDPQHGTYQVAVYCDRPANHEGNHHACIEWDDEPSRIIVAQGSCPLRTTVLPPAVQSPTETDGGQS
jgi:hypothetical protein